MAVSSQAKVPAVAAGQQLMVRRIAALPDAERAFSHLYGASRNAFWLDSSAGGERGRFSFMGDSEGPLAAVITYDVETGRVRIERGGDTELRSESIFDYLDRELRRWRRLSSAELPFAFDCGFAGYLGYELKADCDGEAAHRAPTPDAAFVFADRLVVIDHLDRCAYVIALAGPGESGEAEGWLAETSRKLLALPPLPRVSPSPPKRVNLRLRRSRERYIEDIAACKRYLAAGDSYEICLTNKVLADLPLEPLTLYGALRRANPAPFAAYLRFGDVAVLSSSPERFLAIDRKGWAEARPIKGTSRRGENGEEDAHLAAALRGDEKSRAENVTIVDLLRNDLGRVCLPGTMSVPELMRVETYETVHQLVSSVRGRLRGGIGAAECVRACFPPGSMTGAPKVRTMEILDQLEGEARGVYSGAIGYFGLSGACDLSVAIRTIVLDRHSASIGAGGAIVAQSDHEAELGEMLLKARAPIAALGSDAPISFDSSAAPGLSQRHPPPIPTS